MPRDMTARMKALDDRIQALTVDMNMFVGDLKVQAMASLLTAMVERQALMHREMMSTRADMMSMRDWMMTGGRMNEKTGAGMNHETPDAAPENEPGTMCAPE
jgi:hypothetical protein